jgi:hypothetical protein
VLLIGSLAAAWIAAPAAAAASVNPIKLAISPVGQSGSYFDLTMPPGSSRHLQVDVANYGEASLVVRTYPSDVFTIINGGFGADLRDTAASGMTGWLDYADEAFVLGVGRALRRDFTVAVPSTAAPGEYIASLVLENDRPIADAAAIGLDQVIRQAVAVVVTVPGPRLPALVIGGATHTVVAGTSVISIAVSNTGNIRLKPVVGFTLLDNGGIAISHATLQMGTFYAHTDTWVELPLAALLAPGRYTVALTLHDATSSADADAPAIPLSIDAPMGGSSAAPGEGSGLIDVSGGIGGAPVLPVSALILGMAGALLLVGLARLLNARGRRAQPRADGVAP